MYHCDCGPIFSAASERGVRSVREALREVPVDLVRGDEWCTLDSPDVVLQNINTLDDLVKAQRARSEEAIRALASGDCPN